MEAGAYARLYLTAKAKVAPESKFVRATGHSLEKQDECDDERAQQRASAHEFVREEAREHHELLGCYVETTVEGVKELLESAF